MKWRNVLLPDQQEQIEAALKQLSDEKGMDLILTTGGTGLSPETVHLRLRCV